MTTSPSASAPDLSALETADYTTGVIADCDLVMKGGVTSGVVYPTAMCELAKIFRFRSIGGTSAGALAAALAAAAQYERGLDNRSSAGFQRLAAVSTYLGTGSNLLNLFQPSPRTARLFKLGITWIRKPSWLLLALALVSAYRTWIGGLAIILAVLGATLSYWWHDNLALIIVGLLLFAVGTIALVGRRAFVDVQQRIPDNDFGMCTGLEAPPGAPRPLTPGLAYKIDYLAGRAPADTQPANSTLAPLTFGDLYGPPPDPAANPYPSGSPLLDALNDVNARFVNLQMVTTDVTAGRPFSLPFSDGEDTKFFFSPAELARFFPKRVLDAMRSRALRHTVNVANPIDHRHREQTYLVEFPAARNLPVVVAARMSMSFPFLFSAVPLYGVNRAAYEQWTTYDNHDPAKQPEFRKTWFSDGGLSSNLPIHFFDAPIPRRPTFALNLRGFPRTCGGFPIRWPAKPTDAEKVFPATEYDPDVELFDLQGGARLFQFVNSLLDAMRNWNDNTLMQLPGYRERTVEIAMSDKEGGLNLTMDAATLQSIMNRGVFAADTFRSEFAEPTPARSDHWNGHRHTRLRASLLMQEEWTRRYGLVWNTPPAAGDPPSYASLVGSVQYEWPYAPDEQASATAFAQHLAAAPGTIAPNATLTRRPWPATELRARPRA